jgi:short-subunit dehydrogenase
MTERWLILGASSPIARAFAGRAAAAGCEVILAGRDTEDLARSAADLRARHDATARYLTFDAMDIESHRGFAHDVCGDDPDAAPLSLFVAFAEMPEQAEMELEFGLVRHMIEVNVTGTFSLLEAFAPHLARQGTGHIVVLSSVAGDRGRRSNYFYGATKAALDAQLAGLRGRLYGDGVSVTTVKPGFVDTAMTYGKSLPFPVASPETVAEIAWRAGIKGRDIVYAPGWWRLIMTILRHIPERIFKRLNI